MLQSPQEFFQEVKLASHLFSGITDGTMTHGEGWQFARLGRKLERADKTSRLLDVKYFLLLPTVHDVGTPTDDLQWSAVLRSLSGFEMFRKRHGQISPERVVGFLVLDRLFPRAIMHCIDSANEALHAISGSPEDTFWNPAEKRLGQLRSELAYLHGQRDHLRRSARVSRPLQDKINGSARPSMARSFPANRSAPGERHSWRESRAAADVGRLSPLRPSRHTMSWGGTSLSAGEGRG